MRGNNLGLGWLPGQVAQSYMAAARRNGAEARKALPTIGYQPKIGQEIFPNDTYPTTWDEFVGQDDAKDYLRDAIASAVQRDQRLDHILLASGIPGIGKTALAMLIGAEWGRRFLMVSGQLKAGDAKGALRALGDSDILCIDELHRMVEGGKAKAEWLLNYMQDGLLFEQGQPVPEVPRVTIIGATTDAGRLPATILDRFLIRPKFEPYTELDALMICGQLAQRLGFGELLPMPEGHEFFLDVATAANRVPRLMIPVLIAVRDIYVARDGSNFTDHNYDLTVPLRRAGLHPDGLTDQAVHYLQTLSDLGGTAGERAVANQMREPGGLAYAEQLLVDRKLITRTANGRSLTVAGRQRLRQHLEEVDP